MPVPQRVDFLVGWAGEPAHKKLIETGKMPVPQRVDFLVGWAGEPAHKRLIENGATYKLKQTMVKALKWRILAILTS